MLYIVSTPIGNLEDITLRALKTLFSVDLIYCEDTRKTLFLLNHFKTPEQNIPLLLSFYEENELKRIPEVIEKLTGGANVALVTNAGTPTISDPGFKLIRECRQKGIKVVSVPGASAVTAALAVSGLPTDKFAFIGFLPNKSSKKLKLFNQILKSEKIISSTILFFESPFRLVKSLGDLKSVFGDIEIVICRELTKVFEEVAKEKISVFTQKYSQTAPKGEFVILFNISSCLET